MSLTFGQPVAQARAIPDTDNGGAGSGTTGGSSNPSSPDATDTEATMPRPDPGIYNISDNYQFTYVLDPDAAGGTERDHDVVDWSEVGGGVEHDVDIYTNNPTFGYDDDLVYTWPADSLPQLPDGVVFNVHNGSSGGSGPPLEPSVRPTSIYDAHLDYTGPDSTFTFTWNWHENKSLVLLTGGEPCSTERRLYYISGGGSGLIMPYPGYFHGIWTNLPSEQIAVGSFGNWDTNGTLYIDLPDNTTIDATPRFNGGGTNSTGGTAYPATAIGIGGVAYSLTSRTVASVPLPTSRTTIGVGEEVDLFFSPGLMINASWSCSAGSVLPTNSYHTRFTAPSNATSVTVTMQYLKAKLIKTFNVIVPTGVDHAVTIERQPYSLGQAGAGMHIRPYVGPTNVSFYRVQMMEVGQPATGISGYFVTNAPPPHDFDAGADHFDIQLGYDNAWPSSYDQAKSPVFPSPWSAGQFTWHIPPKWKIGSGPTNDLAGSWDQVFTLGADGTVTVTKFNHTVTRHTTEQYGVVVPDP